MRRPAQIAFVAILAVLASSAALALPQNAWAAGRFGQANDMGDAENIARATLGYSGRSWTTFGTLVGQALALVPTTSISKVDDSLTDGNKADRKSKITESEAVVKEIFLTSQFQVSKASLIELQWNETSESAVLAMTNELLESLGGENDFSTSDSVFGRALFLDEIWGWESAKATQGQILAIRENLLYLQNEVQLSGLTFEAFEKLNRVNKQLEELEALIGAQGDPPAAVTLFGQLSQIKLEKLNDQVDERKILGDFPREPQHIA